MAWPSGTKASTANVDQGSDKIRLARPDIKQNIDNVNDIIDTFDIASATDGQQLQYNSTSGKFESVGGSGHTIAIQFDSTIGQNLSNEIYTGGFTIVGDNATGITVDQPSSGESTITFPAGTYKIETVKDHHSGVYGSTQYDTISFDALDPGDDQIFEGITRGTGFYFRVYQVGRTFTVSTETRVHLTFTTDLQGGGSATHSHADLIVTRLA